MKYLKTFESYQDKVKFMDKIRWNNWDDNQTREDRRKIIRNNQKTRRELKERIEQDIEQGKDLSKWIWGYVIDRGGEHGLDTKKPVYGVYPQMNNHISYVLADSIGGGLQWYNYGNEDIMAGGSDEFREEGIKMYKRLKELKKEAYNPLTDEQGEFDFTSGKKLSIEEIYNIFKKGGIYVFSLNDDRVFQFTDFLKEKGIEYGETSQVGTDITIFDPNTPSGKKFNR